MTSAHKPDKKLIETNEHKDKQRLKNSPVGLVTPETDQEEGSRSYSHDPHLDPQLVWAGKAEHTSFQVPTVSLHLHERIEFSRVEPLPGTHWLHADAETRGDAQRAAVSFGPEHAPLDYDGRSLYPRQVLFPLSGARDGWSRLAKNLQAEVDEELIEAYRGHAFPALPARAPRAVGSEDHRRPGHRESENHGGKVR